MKERINNTIRFLDENIYTILFYRLLLVFVLYFLCRITFLAFNYSYFSDITFGGLITVFLGGIRFDASAIMYTNSLVILMTILPFKFRHAPFYQKVLAYLFFIFNGIGLAFNIMDIGYYPVVKNRTTAYIFSQFSNEKNGASLLGQFLVDYWYLFVVFALFLALLIYSYNRFKTIVIKSTSHKQYYLGSIMMIPIVLVIMLYSIRGDFKTASKPLFINDAAKYVEKPTQVPLVLNTPFTVIRTIGKNRLKRRDFYSNPHELEATYSPIHTPYEKTDFTPKNVVVIILESFGREYIGALNRSASESYTPFLDSLISQSAVFEHAFANGTRSVEAPPSIFASIPSCEIPFSLSDYAGNNIHSLAHCLKEEGYNTSFFHGADKGSMRFDAFYKMAGFDHYFTREEYNYEANFDGCWGIWDEPYLQYFAHKLDSLPQPFLSGVFTLSSHHPFKVPEQYKDHFKKGTLPIHQVIQYSDNALRQYFATASRMKWFKNTLFVITADHAAYADKPEYKTIPGSFAIPIIFYNPGDPTIYRDTKTVAQHIDIMPTVLGYLHYNKPYFAFGKNLFDYRYYDNFAFNMRDGQYQLFYRNWLLVASADAPIGLYDLTEGFYCKNNYLQQLPDKSDSLYSITKAFEQQYYNRLIENKLTLQDEN